MSVVPVRFQPVVAGEPHVARLTPPGHAERPSSNAGAVHRPWTFKDQVAGARHSYPRSARVRYPERSVGLTDPKTLGPWPRRPLGCPVSMLGNRLRATSDAGEVDFA